MPWILLLFMLGGAALGAFFPYVAVILSERGFPPAAIGLVTALTSIAAVAAVPVWGHLADVVLGRRRALRVAATVASACLVLFTLSVHPILTALVLVAWALFHSALQPLSDAIAVNALPDPERDYGRLRATMSAAFAVSTVSAGVLFTVAGYPPAGLLYVALTVPIALIVAGIPDRKRAVLVHRGRGGAFREAFAVQPALPGVLAAIALLYIGIHAAYTFLPLRMVALGGGPTEIGLASAGAAAVEVPSMIALGRWGSRIGLRAMFAGSAALFALAFGAWAIITTPEGLVVARAAAGLAFATSWIAGVLVMRSALPASLQATGQGLFQMTGFGIAPFVANLIGGVLYGTAGAPVLFGLAATMAAAGGFLGWLVLPHRGGRLAEAPDRTAEPAADGTTPTAAHR